MNYVRQQKDPTSRIVGIVVVVLFHLLLIYALVTGLGHNIIEVIKGPLETKIIDESKKDDAPPPPPPPPKFVPPPAYVPPVDIQVAVQPDRPAISAISREVPRAAPPPPPAPKAVATTPAQINKSGCRFPEYPPAAKRAGESGTVVVSFLVDAEGRVKESKVASSSGSSRLDEAARVALSLCKFTPATVDGKPVADDTWTSFRYVWKLED